MAKFIEILEPQRQEALLKQWMRCHYEKSIPSSKLYAPNGIDGHRRGESTLRKRTQRRNAPSRCLRGQTSFFRKSSDSSWKATSSQLLAISHMASGPAEDVTQHSDRLTTIGTGQIGLSKEISKRALTDCPISFSSKRWHKTFKMERSIDSDRRCFKH